MVKNEVEIIAYKKVNAENRETAEKIMERVEIDIRESDDEIIIETYYPKGSSGQGIFSWFFGGRKASVSVEYEIRVPENIDLNISLPSLKAFILVSNARPGTFSSIDLIQFFTFMCHSFFLTVNQ